MEFILAGAHAVAVGTASFSDPETVFRIVSELPSFCEQMGISDLDSFRGSLEV
jgi:dihydroorotate dehydrogenase (NAD+) catalytic subunit